MERLSKCRRPTLGVSRGPPLHRSRVICKWLLCWSTMGGQTHGCDYLFTCMNDYLFHVFSQSYLYSVAMGNCMSRDTSTDNAAKKREFDDLKSRSDTDNGHNSGGGTGGRQPKPHLPVSPPPTPAPPPSGKPCS